jgi:multiple sugar transport system ATP-binding protein
MAETIRITDLTKRFDNGRIVAVDDLSLEIPSGSFTSIVGPSGCGKTTLLRSIAGLESVKEGTIRFGSKEVTTMTPQERDLSMIFQDVTLYPHLSCRENIGYPLKVDNISKSERDERIEEAAELLQITDQLEKSPAELSGGQQQRVGLAAAIVNSSDIILLDEPMSDLDAKLKAELRVELQRLHQELDTTMVYVTHNQTEAMTMSDNVVVMRKGTVEQAGAPTDVFRTPSSEYVARFIGQPEMNILPVEAVPGVDANGTSDVGIRPGDLSTEPDGFDITFDVQINVIEPLGTDFIVHTDYDGYDVTVDTRVEPDYDVGETVTVGTTADSIHRFSADGKRIASGEEQHDMEDTTHEL